MQPRGRLCDHVKREVIKGHTGAAGSEQRLEGSEGVGQNKYLGRALLVEGTARAKAWRWELPCGFEEKQKGQCDCKRAKGGDGLREDQGQMVRNGAHHKDFYLSVMSSPCGVLSRRRR